MGRTENVLVFEDTEKLCTNNARIKEAVRQSTEGQKLILEKDELPVVNRKRYDTKAKIIVSGKRTYEAASAYKDTKVVVHNFASASNPGGGVERGSSAQEECLCRCSGLFFSLNTPKMLNGFYIPHRRAHNPIHNDDIIYTPDVTVFKSDTEEPKLMPESEWYDVDVITCAAPNLNIGDGSCVSKSVPLYQGD